MTTEGKLKSARLAETTRSMAKLIQLALVRLGADPSALVARKTDLRGSKGGLTFGELMYWLAFSINALEFKCKKILPANEAIQRIQRWKKVKTIL
jgi:hypothetical protein